eukprot:Tbor_TRINITY_DN5938_c2_g5::TRINITY_DN5938_c2_g5_i1::g.18820::m.18820
MKTSFNITHANTDTVYMLGSGHIRFNPIKDTRLDESNIRDKSSNRPSHQHPSNASHLDGAKVRWAWSADKAIMYNKPAVKSVMTESDVNCDGGYFSSTTPLLQRQTAGHSNDIAKLERAREGSAYSNSVQSRNIGTQNGVCMSSSTQVDERDIMPSTLIDSYDGIQLRPYSAHQPFSQVPAEQFPDIIEEAQIRGVCNRYGFLSMPKRPDSHCRSFNSIQPLKYGHSDDNRQLSINKQFDNQLARTYDLWNKNTWFVKKL